MSVGQRLREIVRAISSARVPAPPKEKHDPYDPVFEALARPSDAAASEVPPDKLATPGGSKRKPRKKPAKS